MWIQKSCLKAAFAGCILIIVTSMSVSAQCPSSFELDGLYSLSRMGNAATAVGDVDADGYEDFAIAASGAVSVPGFVHVISGKTHEQIHLLHEPGMFASGISFGYSVAGIGDINQDGHADILVGVRDFYQSRTGHAYAFSGADGADLMLLQGQVAKSMFGASVASAGDCNADGINDFLVGAPMEDLGDGNTGKVYLYSGSDGSLLNTFAGVTPGGFGTSIDGGEDVNGDGTPDVLISAPFNDENGVNSGEVFVYSSAGGAPLYTFTVAVPSLSTNIGKSLSFTGDLNTDGVADVIANVGGVNVVEIHSGTDGALIGVIPRPQDTANIHSNLGVRIAGGGDVDGDGIFDIAIAAPEFKINGVRAGAVFIYSGSDFQLLREQFASAEQESFGYGLDISGDYNQDGLADLIVGATGNSEQAQNAGKAYMYTCAPCCALAGDANHDSSANIADVTFLIGRIFSAGPAPFCADAADTNGDNSVNIADATTLIARIFSGGAEPVCGTTGT